MSNHTHNTKEELLKRKGVNPTAMRLLILQEFLKDDNAKTLSDIEQALAPADKVTIYRTIKTFVDNGIVHPITLNRGTTYALCKHSEQEHHIHPHFSCLQCGMTHCLLKTEVHLESVPSQYEIMEVNLTVMGYCKECRSSKEIP